MKSLIAFARNLCGVTFGRTQRTQQHIAKSPGRRRLFKIEPLENRMLLSADLVGIPVWDDQGAAPIQNAQVNVPPGNFATGAVESLVVNPNNLQQIYVGTVNGGIFRTNNADSSNPDATTWTPLTDQHLSLAMGDIAFSPLDPTGNTLFAGTGSFSSLGQSGGPAVGILRTTDGGTTWQNFAVNPAGENQVKAIVPTSIDLDAGPGVQQIVLVATVGGGGLYRSNDNGQTFTLLSGANGLPNADVSQLRADPTNPNRFYAGVANNGVYRGDFSAGVITWTAVNTGITNIGTAGNIQIAVIDSIASPGTTVLFALLSDSAAAGNQGAFRSADNGGNWTPLATPPTLFNRDVTVRAGNTIVIDPTDDTVAYIATYGGGNDIFRYDPSGAGSWVVIDNAGALGGTAPHADFRDLEFQGNNVLIGVNDGGIYFIQNPLNAIANAWHAYIGGGGTGLADTEIHNLAWDGRFNVIAAGLQDNGTNVQTATGNSVWDHFQGGDGGDVQIDSVSLGGVSIRYASSQNLDSFTRYVFNSATNVLSSVGLFPGNVLPANFSGTFVSHFELNTLDPAAGQSKAIVIGGGGTSPVYVGTMPDVVNVAGDVTWTAVPVAAGFGTVNAMAFGGRRSGVDNPDVLYAGTGNGLFVRTTAGGTLNATAVAFPGGGVTDVTLDPNDWQHAFVSSSSGVWETTDAGATWTNRTGNLVNTNIQTIEYAEVGAVDAVLVGGQGGVFRMRTNSPGAWSEYGEFLPNAVTFDLDYDFTDNIVVAGTFGRGAWTVDNARDTLVVPGVLVIEGDENGFAEDDVIRLIRQAANPSLLDVFINSVTPVRTVQMSVLEQINVYGLGGNDTLILDSTNGLINVPLGIRYDGGDGNNDQLQLLQTGGPVHPTDTYSVGPDLGAGVSTIVGTGTAGTQKVFFENLSPVLDLVPAALLTVNATGADNAISYTTGVVAPGRVAIDEHEPIEFSNKTALVINAAGGSDTLSINNPVTPVSLTGITVNGGDPGSGDALIVSGVGVAVTVNTVTGTIAGATGAGGAVPITYTTVETLGLPAGIGNLTITTTGADDVATVTPGLAAGANSGTVESSGAVPQISFVNSGTFTANLGLGNDSLIVNGSSNPDTVAVSAAAVAITGRRTVNVTGEEALRVNGQGGSDTFNVTPSATVGIFIDGGDPVGVTPGDLLNILAGGGSVTYNAGPETDEGSFVVSGSQAVSFDHIESFGITGSGPVVINGTNGPDTITVIARDASTHGAANGVQDFTVSVNSGPELLFIDVASLTVNALSGSDQVTLSAPAPNNAVWDVDVTVNGGAPAADTDRLIVQTPGAASEDVVFVPSAADGGTLDLTSLSSLITITTTEVLSYDGLGDNDGLSVVGTGGDDVIVHLPGSNDQAGSLQVNSLLALGYQGMGAAGSVAARGAGGTDTLVVHGTAANDSFTVGTAGQVNLNSRVVLNTTTIETLTLEGFNGDDTFTLVPAISASVYTTMNFNGGAQASAAGDRVNLIATGGADAIAVSGQAVSLGGKTVQSSGVEDIRLDALAGDDLLTYSGVAGVTENINVSSSGIAGGGQLSAPGVTLVNFSGVERVDVNGNAPTPTETDTLSFTGTNAEDVFQINLAADGTNADPILKLENTSGATLLTLRNYINFATLNVFGLDGEDVFNVRTDASGPSRNLFVDGGIPAGKKKQTDNLYIFYVPPRPHIIHSAATQDPDAGLVDLDYDTAQFLVQYDGMEQIVIRKE